MLFRLFAGVLPMPPLSCRRCALPLSRRHDLAERVTWLVCATHGWQASLDDAALYRLPEQAFRAVLALERSVPDDLAVTRPLPAAVAARGRGPAGTGVSQSGMEAR